MTRTGFSRALFLALFIPTLAPADELLPCKLDRGKMTSCSRIVACVTPPDMVFVGRGFGWNHGTITGKLDGVNCTGSWVGRNFLGVGEARMSCDNGMTGTVFFTWQDSLTGTATGRGLTNLGQAIRAWSGNNIKAYISRETGKPDARLMCGDQEIPIS